MQVIAPSFEQIIVKPISWLWPGWIASGTLHLLAGEAGSGKSGIALDLASRISLGGLLPDGETLVERGSTLMYAPEDSESTIKGRLVAAGADLSQVRILQASRGRLNPVTHIKDIQDMIVAQRPKLVILDPITSFARGQSGQSVRDALETLANIAQESGSAILGITHFAKGSAKRSVLDRILNSQAYTAVPRMVIVTGFSSQTDSKVIVRAKSNMTEVGGGVTYRIGARAIDLDSHHLESTAISWGSSVDGFADELLSGDIEESPDRPLQMAKIYLQRLLSQGPLPSTEVLEGAEHDGHAERTLKRAKANLGIRAFKEGQRWLWGLPEELAGEIDQGCHAVN